MAGRGATLIEHIRVATRQSPLALWQTHCVIDLLKKAHSHLSFSIVPIVSEGDKHLDQPLQALGGKSLFVKSLEQAIMDGRADIAVHSIKDMGAVLGSGWAMPAILERADARDVWISPKYPTLKDCPEGAVIGTSSPRRQCQILHFNPKLRCEPIRGNVQTRLKKLSSGQFDGVVMAAAGLLRMGLDEHIRDYLSEVDFIPAIGQGAIGVECLKEREDLCELLNAIDHASTRLCVSSERSLNAILGGDCFLPIAAHAYLNHDHIHMSAMVGSVTGECETVRLTVHQDQSFDLAERVYQALEKKQALRFLQ